MIRLSAKTLTLFALAIATGCISDGGGNDDRPIFEELEALDTTADPTCAGTWIAGVSGRIVDEAGSGVGMALPQMCVRNGEVLNCLAPDAARADGWFAKVIPESSRCMDELNFRAFLPMGPYGTTYCQSDLRVSEGILEISDPLVLYNVEPAADLPPEGDPDMVRTVTIADGLEIDVRPAPLFGQYGSIGGARVDGATCFADTSFDGLYALTPESATYPITTGGTGFPIRIPTTLAEGTTVDLFVLGGLDEFELANGETLHEGAFLKFGTGTVTGGKVVSDPGSELPYMSWLGFRAQ